MAEYTYRTYGTQRFVLIPGGEISDEELAAISDAYAKALRESMRESTEHALSVAAKRQAWE